jgi:predicted MPP superfamily phosphohydrolase
VISLVYLAAISLIAVILTVYDKRAAVKGAWRVKELTLLAVAAFGGSAAMFATMLAVRHKTRRKKFMLGVPLIIAAQVLAVAVPFNQSLSVERFSIATDKLDGEVKLALITDLHSCSYGEAQRGLIGAIDAEQPDAVLFAGDVFDDRQPPYNTEQLMRVLATKYACFYVAGNHDTEDEYKQLAESMGVTVFAGTSAEFMGIRIAGIDDPDVERYARIGSITTTAAPYAEQLENLRQTLTADKFTIILSHRPERMDEFLPMSPDLVVSGHAHGGQWRVPYILENGLVAPNQGFFPKYTNGAYQFGDATLIVSRGLARESTRIPRLFNRPELAIITVAGTQK